MAGAGGLRAPPASAPQPALRPRRWRHGRIVLGGGLRRDHRVRLADGRHVHRPAVPAERARLLHPRGRARPSCPRRSFMVLVAPRSAKLVEATGARFTLLLGYVFVLARLRHDARASGRTARATGRSASATPSSASGSGFAGTPASHSLTGVGAGRAGPAWPRAPPTSSATSVGRSCSRSSARCSPPATPRRSAPLIAGVARRPTQVTAASRPSSPSRSPAPTNTAEQYPQYSDADHRRRQAVVRRRPGLGLLRGHRRRAAGGVRSCGRCSRGETTSAACWRSTSTTTAPTRPDPRMPIGGRRSASGDLSG